MIKFEIVKNSKNKNIKLPTRADSGSAGYDFYLPQDIEIKPQETVFVPTDIKVKMEKDMVLLLYIRSSIGIKRKVVLACGTGVIDSTYYENADNDGNIGFAFYNYGNEVQKFSAGERLMQGVFVKYYTTDNDAPLNKQRSGGFGSSGK